MTAKLRAGLVGLGSMGRHHARVLSTTPDVELVAVADSDPGQLAVASHAGPAIYRSVEDVIHAGVDMCVVAVPTRHHEPVCLALAEAGIHTLVEKPIAPDLESGRRIADAFASRGLIGAVGHIERFNPALQSLRARLETGDLGDVYQVATRRQGPFPARIADIGVVMDLASHDIDITSWITQEPIRTVFAQVAHKSGRLHEDLVAAVAGLEDGTVCNYLVNWLSPFKERVITVTGERGCFIADTLTADLTFYANGQIQMEWEQISMFRGVSEGDMVRYAIPKPEPLRTEIESFRNAVLGKGNDVVTMQEGVAVVRVAEALLASAHTGQAATVEVEFEST